MTTYTFQVQVDVDDDSGITTARVFSAAQNWRPNIEGSIEEACADAATTIARAVRAEHYGDER